MECEALKGSSASIILFLFDPISMKYLVLFLLFRGT